MGSTWCRQCMSQAVCLVFFLRIKGTRLARDKRLVWSRTSWLSFLPRCLQKSDWVGFWGWGGGKILNSRHACLAAGQTRPVNSFLFLIRTVSFRMLKKDLRPRTSLFTDSRLPNSFLSGLNWALLNWWVVDQKGFLLFGLICSFVGSFSFVVVWITLGWDSLTRKQNAGPETPQLEKHCIR